MDKTIYTYILTKTDGTYLGWSKAPKKPPNGNPDNMQWVDWRTSQDILDEDGKRIKKNGRYVKAMQGNPLADDIDSGKYTYSDGKLEK